MGNCSHNSAILQDRTAGHPLDDAAGDGEQLRVRHGDEKVPLLPVPQAAELHLVVLHAVPRHVAPDDGGAVPDLGALRHGNGVALRQGAGGERPEDAAGGVGAEGAEIRRQIKISLQLSGGPGLAPLHGLHRGGQDAAAGEGQQLGGVRVRDAVAQGAESPGGGIIVGDGADARHAVPDPGADDPGAVLIPLRLRRQGLGAAAPVDSQLHFLLPLEEPLELLRGGDGGAVALQDHVPLGKAAGLRRALPLREIHHQDAPGEHLDAHGVAHGDQLPRRLRRPGREAQSPHDQEHGETQRRPGPPFPQKTVFMQ